MEPVKQVQDHHIEWRGGGALLAQPMNVDIGVITATIREPVDERRVTVVSKNDRLVDGKQGVDTGVVQAMPARDQVARSSGRRH